VVQIDVNCSEFFTVSTLTHTRGNSRKLMKTYSFATRDAHVFSNCVINCWNKLPDYVVQAPSTASFKKLLFSFVNSAGGRCGARFNFVVFDSDVMAT